jgi:hypothetical protein
VHGASGGTLTPLSFAPWPLCTDRLLPLASLRRFWRRGWCPLWLRSSCESLAALLVANHCSFLSLIKRCHAPDNQPKLYLTRASVWVLWALRTLFDAATRQSHEQQHAPVPITVIFALAHILSPSVANHCSFLSLIRRCHAPDNQPKLYLTRAS